MMKCHVLLYSKNKKSLNNFFQFFKHNTKKQKTQESLKYVKRKKTKKKITVLKSPHVNKSAQEQFEYTIYSLQLYFYSYRTKKNLVVLKRIKNQLFPDIKIKIKNFIQNEHGFVEKISLNPNNFKINLYKFNTIMINQPLNPKNFTKRTVNIRNKNLLQKTSYYLNLLNLYGKLN